MKTIHEDEIARLGVLGMKTLHRHHAVPPEAARLAREVHGRHAPMPERVEQRVSSELERRRQETRAQHSPLRPSVAIPASKPHPR